MKKRDIKTVSDIRHLIDAFYTKVAEDSLLGHVFIDVMKIDWNAHLPQMVDFWKTILFGIPAYKGNPMLKHFVVNKQTSLSATHFNRWLELWESTIDMLFEGDNASNAKLKARNMSIGIQRSLGIS